MKNLILIISIISFSWTQCDANNDGGLDVMDIIVQVNCILEECWEYEEPSESIYGFWMLDSAHAEVTMNDTLLFNDSIYCGQYDEYNNEYEGALVIYFIENNQGGEMNIDHTFCGLDEIDISNPSWQGSWEYDYYDDYLVIHFEDYYYDTESVEFTIISLNESDLILNVSMYDEYYGMNQEMTYWFGRVSTGNSIRKSKLNTSNNSPAISLNYKKYLKSLNIIAK